MLAAHDRLIHARHHRTELIVRHWQPRFGQVAAQANTNAMAKAAFNPKHRAHRIFWVLNSGAHWRDMPERYGQWETIYGRYRRWVREGLFDRMFFRREPRRRYGGASQSRLSVGWIPA